MLVMTELSHSFLQWSSEFPPHTRQVLSPPVFSRQSWQKLPAHSPLQNESAGDFFFFFKKVKTGNSEELQFEIEKEAIDHYNGFVL